MIGWAELAAFNLALAAALVSPGPALLYQVRAAVGGGRAHAIATGLGLAAMAATWTALALLGLGGLLAVVPALYAVLKIVGALYLIWIAVQTWRAAGAPSSAACS